MHSQNTGVDGQIFLRLQGEGELPLVTDRAGLRPPPKLSGLLNPYRTHEELNRQLHKLMLH